MRFIYENSLWGVKMDAFIKQYIQLCDEKYTSLGFGRTQHTYARITNDVVQMFSLKRMHKKSMCTIEFGLFPLCLGALSLDMCNYTIDGFDVSAYASHGFWHYNRNSKDSIYACITAMLFVVDNNLMPFFERANCSDTALSELIHLDESFENNRLAALAIMGESNCARPWQEISLQATEKYYMALKTHNYEYAKAYLQLQIQSCKAVISASQTGPKQPQVVIRRYSQELILLQNQLEMLEKENVAFFDKMILCNEKRSRAELFSKYPFLKNKI